MLKECNAQRFHSTVSFINDIRLSLLGVIMTSCNYSQLYHMKISSKCQLTCELYSLLWFIKIAIYFLHVGVIVMVIEMVKMYFIK